MPPAIAHHHDTLLTISIRKKSRVGPLMIIFSYRLHIRIISTSAESNAELYTQFGLCLLQKKCIAFISCA